MNCYDKYLSGLVYIHTGRNIQEIPEGRLRDLFGIGLIWMAEYLLIIACGVFL